MLGRNRLDVTVRVGRWRSARGLAPPIISVALAYNSRPKSPVACEKRVERASTFFRLKVPVLAGVLASEPDNAGAFLARAVAADVCEPQLAPVFRDDSRGGSKLAPIHRRVRQGARLDQ